MINTNQIINKIKTLKKKKQTIGLCHGVFDLIHYGHIKHFEIAKKNCDYLFVSITSEKFDNVIDLTTTPNAFLTTIELIILEELIKNLPLDGLG